MNIQNARRLDTLHYDDAADGIAFFVIRPLRDMRMLVGTSTHWFFTALVYGSVWDLIMWGIHDED